MNNNNIISTLFQTKRRMSEQWKERKEEDSPDEASCWPTWSWSASTPVAVGAVGLRNLGNTCYANASLQCLSNTLVLREFLLSDELERSVSKSNPMGYGGHVALAFGKLIRKMWSDKSSSVVVPSGFLDQLPRFAASFVSGRQHDSFQFISCVLDAVHEDLNKVFAKPYVARIEARGRADAEVAAEAWDGHVSREDSPLVPMFHGLQKLTDLCNECGFRDTTFDPFMSLNLRVISEQLRLVGVDVSLAGYDVVRHVLKLNELSSVADAVDQVRELHRCEAADLMVFEKRGNLLLPVRVDLRVVDLVGCLHCFVLAVDRVMCIVQKRGALTDVSFTIPVSRSVKEMCLAVYGAIIFHPEMQERTGLDAGCMSDGDWDDLMTEHPLELRAYAGDDATDASVASSRALVVVWRNHVEEEEEDMEDMDIPYLGVRYDRISFRRYKSKIGCVVEGDSSLGACLAEHFSQTTLTGDDQMFCDQCDDCTASCSEVTLWSVPRVLVLHLERFREDERGSKYDGLVDYPLRLNLSDYIGEGGAGCFELYAVSVES